MNETKTNAVQKSVLALLVALLAAIGMACGNDIAESPADASLAAFLATSAPQLDPGEIGLIASPVFFDGLEHLSTRTEFVHDKNGQSTYGVMPMSRGASLSAFLATSAPELNPKAIGVIASPGFFNGLEHVTTRVEFAHGERTLAYGVVPMSEGTLLAAALYGDLGVEAYASSCRLGGDYYDRPGAWDFIRNTDKAKLWTAWGDCIDALMGQTANTQCVVTMTLEWNESEEYWDAISSLVCPDPR